MEQIRWPHPVRPGDRLRVEVEVRGSSPVALQSHRGIVRFKSQTLNQNDEVVMEQIATLVAPRPD